MSARLKHFAAHTGGGTESFNYVIQNASDLDSTVYDTNRVGGGFQYGFTPAQVAVLLSRDSYLAVFLLQQSHTGVIYW